MLFPKASYTVLGSTGIDPVLTAVLKQPFLLGETAGLKIIKELLELNGFVNTKRQDYLHQITEDMRDENVIRMAKVYFP